MNHVNRKLSTYLSSFKVLELQPVQFSCAVDAPPLVLVSIEVIAPHCVGCIETRHGYKEPRLFLLPGYGNSSYEVSCELMEPRTCVGVDIYLVLDLPTPISDVSKTFFLSYNAYVALIDHGKFVLIDAGYMSQVRILIFRNEIFCFLLSLGDINGDKFILGRQFIRSYVEQWSVVGNPISS